MGEALPNGHVLWGKVTVIGGCSLSRPEIARKGLIYWDIPAPASVDISRWSWFVGRTGHDLWGPAKVGSLWGTGSLEVSAYSQLNLVKQPIDPLPSKKSSFVGATNRPRNRIRRPKGLGPWGANICHDRARLV